MTQPILMAQDSQPTRSDAVKNRALLLETAARLFAEKDVHDVSATDIAEAAGVGKGTLYRHFPNGKTDICIALLDEEQRNLQNRVLEYLQTHHDPRNNLEWFLSEAFTFVERNRSLLCAGVEGKSGLEHPAHWWWRQTIYGLLLQMNVPGDLEYIADSLYIMLDVSIVFYLQSVRGYESARMRDNLLSMFNRLTAA
jgi:AcrR family transcriptional regulator